MSVLAKMGGRSVGWLGKARDGVVAMRVITKSTRLKARMIGAVKFFTFPP